MCLRDSRHIDQVKRDQEDHGDEDADGEINLKVGHPCVAQSVSYTHLDVYKRQPVHRPNKRRPPAPRHPGGTGNTVELSGCHSFGFINLPFVNGFFGDTGLRGSWDFGSVIAHPGALVEEFGEDHQGPFRTFWRQDKGFFGQGDHGMFELGFDSCGRIRIGHQGC